MVVTKVNSLTFEEEVVKSDIPVIADFWASWCAPCRMMAPAFEELSKEYAGKLKFIKINTETEQQLSMMYNITGIPCLVVMQNGREIDRIVGFMPKELLKEKIDNILKR